MSAGPDQRRADGVDEAIVDDYGRRRFGVEPQDDPSGLDGSRSSLPPGEFDKGLHGGSTCSATSRHWQVTRGSVGANFAPRLLPRAPTAPLLGCRPVRQRRGSPSRRDGCLHLVEAEVSGDAAGDPAEGKRARSASAPEDAMSCCRRLDLALELVGVGVDLLLDQLVGPLSRLSSCSSIFDSPSTITAALPSSSPSPRSLRSPREMPPREVPGQPPAPRRRSRCR